MNANISVFVICVEAIIYLFLCDLHDCTFNMTVPLSAVALLYQYSLTEWGIVCKMI